MSVVRTVQIIANGRSEYTNYRAAVLAILAPLAGASLETRIP